MPAPMKCSETALVDLLRVRHSQDVFVPQCKSGPSQGAEHLRLDAWVLRKSWSRPLAIGYEIKVTRADFLRDDKWRGYLPYCNEFYFVVPSGLIKPDELSAEAGLLVATANLTKLYRKKKAPYRDVVIPEEIYRYILFARTRVTREYYQEQNDKAFWLRWLVGREEDAELGWRIGKRLQETIKERVNKVAEENTLLTGRMSQYDDIRQLLKKLDIDSDSYAPAWSVETRLRKLRQAVPPELLGTLQRARRELKHLHEKLKDLHHEGEPDG